MTVIDIKTRKTVDNPQPVQDDQATGISEVLVTAFSHIVVDTVPDADEETLRNFLEESGGDLLHVVLPTGEHFWYQPADQRTD